MEKKSCFFAGHKNLPAGKIEQIVISLDRQIEKLIEDGVTDFFSGGVIGFDQIAASLIAAKKEMGKNIRLILALPYKNQEVFWDQNRKELYLNLLNEADKIIYVSEKYVPFCIKKRNKYMVEHSSHCICALLKEKSETSKTIHLARKKGLHIVNVVK